MSICKSIFTLNKVHDYVVSGNWVTYRCCADPSSLWSWGTNTFGVLGLGDIISRSSPVQVTGTTWTIVTGGNSMMAGIQSDGTLYTWGCNTLGELGLGDRIHRCAPTQVPGTLWKDVSGGAHVTSIKTDGTLWAWGYNNHGQLGGALTSPTRASSPVQIPGTQWDRLANNTNSSGGSASFAFKTDGTLWTWGRNTCGVLANETNIDRSSPIQIPGNWVDLSLGVATVLARKQDGTLWAWGCSYSSAGSLGDNTIICRCSPVQVPGTSWTRIHTSGGVSKAIKSDNTLWVWGFNTTGRLGVNDVIHRSSPVQIPGTSWVETFGSSRAHSGIKADGTLWSWGEGGFVGDGTRITRSSPVQIPGCWSFISGADLNTSGKRLS